MPRNKRGQLKLRYQQICNHVYQALLYCAEIYEMASEENSYITAVYEVLGVHLSDLYTKLKEYQKEL